MHFRTGAGLRCLIFPGHSYESFPILGMIESVFLPKMVGFTSRSKPRRNNMAFPTSTIQIPETATQLNLEVVAASPAVAMGNYYLATSHALSIEAHNATTAQQHSNATAQAATSLGVLALYSTVFGSPKPRTPL